MGALTAQCMACAQGVSVETLCREDPGTAGCDGVAAGGAKDVEASEVATKGAVRRYYLSTSTRSMSTANTNMNTKSSHPLQLYAGYGWWWKWYIPAPSCCVCFPVSWPWFLWSRPFRVEQ